MIHLFGFIRRMMVIFLRQYFARNKLPAHGEQSLSRMPRTPNARMSVPCRMPHAPLNGPPLTAHLTRNKLCTFRHSRRLAATEPKPKHVLTAPQRHCCHERGVRPRRQACSHCGQCGVRTSCGACGVNSVNFAAHAARGVWARRAFCVCSVRRVRRVQRVTCGRCSVAERAVLAQAACGVRCVLRAEPVARAASAACHAARASRATRASAECGACSRLS